MGTPLPPNLIGDPCTVCWGPSKRFGDNPTPRVLTVTLHDLEPGVFWADAFEQLLLSPHLLIQGPTPCRWSIFDGEFQFIVNFFLGRTAVDIIQVRNSAIVLANSFAAECTTNIANVVTSPIGVYAFNGFAAIGWDPEGLE